MALLFFISSFKPDVRTLQGAGEQHHVGREAAGDLSLRRPDLGAPRALDVLLAHGRRTAGGEKAAGSQDVLGKEPLNITFGGQRSG